MKFEEFISTITKKFHPDAVFGLSRDARITALENILIEKEIATKSEIDAETEKQFGKTAQQITQIPTIQSPNIPNQANEKNS